MSENESEKQEQPSSKSDSEEQGGGKKSWIEKLKDAPPWVWIGLLVAIATLVVAWLAYSHGQGVNTPYQAPQPTIGNSIYNRHHSPGIGGGSGGPPVHHHGKG